jgi:hypothetical protein
MAVEGGTWRYVAEPGHQSVTRLFLSPKTVSTTRQRREIKRPKKRVKAPDVRPVEKPNTVNWNGDSSSQIK